MTAVLEDLDAVLPEAISRQLGAPDKPPESFGEGYKLPEHSQKPLQLVNFHPNDEFLVFYEIPHVYSVHGVPVTTSVTAIAHEYETPFVATEAISLMKTSRSQAWPRLDYVVDSRPGLAEWTPDRGALMVRGGKTVAVVPPHSLPPDASEAQVREMLHLPLSTSRKRAQDDDADEEECYYHFTREYTAEEIEEGWKRKGAIARDRGTEGHWLCECFFNGLPVRWWEPEMAVLFDFIRQHLLPRGIVGYNTEKEISCAEADVAGSIGLIVYEPATGMHHIIDFKRSDKLQVQMHGYKKMKPPLNHLDDCKGAAYALQTGIYQWVLEREYGMKIGDRILLSIHPDKPFATSVPYLKAEVEFVMENRIALTRARRAVQEAFPEFTCALTKAPLVDAVQLEALSEEGTVQMCTEKASLMFTMEAEPATAVRTAFNSKVAEYLVPIAPRRGEFTPWRKRMPVGGLSPLA